MRNKILCVAALFFLAAVSRAAEPTAAPASVLHSSPEAVYKVYREACHKRDWRTVLSCYTAERQKYEIFEFYFASQVKPDTPKLQETLKKYGVEQDKVDAELLKAIAAYKQKHRHKLEPNSTADTELCMEVVFNRIADKPGFYEAMSNIFPDPEPRKIAELNKVTLQESTAQGYTTTILPGPVLANGQPVNKIEQRIPKVINFVKVNGGWLLNP